MKMRTMPKVGDSASIEVVITDEMVRKFAEISGDRNPVHLDDDFAATTRFKKRIAHGMLVGSVLSRLAGMEVPGPGTIVMSQETRYKAPCYIDDKVTGEIRIVNVREDKPIVKAAYTIKNQDGVTLIEGETTLYFDRSIG